MLKNERGFTIIELLLVLLGAVLFASMGLYGLRTHGQMQLSRAARDMQMLIRETQDRAYGEQDLYEVGFYIKEGRCVQIRNNRITKNINVPSSVRIKSINFPNGALSFNGKLTPSGGGTIVLYSKSHKVDITVLPVTGRVKIYPVERQEGGSP